MAELLPDLWSARLDIGAGEKVVMTHDRVLTLRNNSHRVNKIPEVFTKTRFVSIMNQKQFSEAEVTHCVL